jgi:branched-chain amino acid transport system ATP-binding protein
VTIDVEIGERHVIIGPNGAGKTTLFNFISGLVTPLHGSVELGGHDVSSLADYQRVRAGLARTFQVSQLCMRLTVLEHLKLAYCRDLKFTKLLRGSSLQNPELIGKAESLLRGWSLWHLRDFRPSDISYGHQRLLEIVLALAQSPAVVLLDEPTAGLSATDTSALLDHIRAMPRSVAVAVIEHDIDAAFAIAERVTVLQSGRVVASGPPDLIRDDPEVCYMLRMCNRLMVAPEFCRASHWMFLPAVSSHSWVAMGWERAPW